MSLGLTGEEVFTIRGLAGQAEVPRTVTVTADGPNGTRAFTAVRIDTPASALTTGTAESSPTSCATSPAPERPGLALLVHQARRRAAELATGINRPGYLIQLHW